MRASCEAAFITCNKQETAKLNHNAGRDRRLYNLPFPDLNVSDVDNAEAFISFTRWQCG